MKFINKLIRDEAGATAIEYGLIAALIAVAAITAMNGLGNQLKTTFNTTSSSMPDYKRCVGRRGNLPPLPFRALTLPRRAGSAPEWLPKKARRPSTPRLFW
ncbi:hypothetical protein E4T56_gene6656 [Termitomyces sp. T112]|nr:hypothetical protein E4T56_gene6656 [Termitomyces sp. T112]